MKNKALLIIPGILQFIMGLLGLVGSLMMIIPILSKGPNAYFMLLFLIIPIGSLSLSIGLFMNKNWAIFATPIVSMLILILGFFIMLNRNPNIVDGIWVVFCIICMVLPLIYQFKSENTRKQETKL